MSEWRWATFVFGIADGFFTVTAFARYSLSVIFERFNRRASCFAASLFSIFCGVTLFFPSLFFKFFFFHCTCELRDCQWGMKSLEVCIHVDLNSYLPRPTTSSLIKIPYSIFISVGSSLVIDTQKNFFHKIRLFPTPSNPSLSPSHPKWDLHLHFSLSLEPPQDMTKPAW